MAGGRRRIGLRPRGPSARPPAATDAPATLSHCLRCRSADPLMDDFLDMICE
ncbi:hypothetical protein BURCENBC7_AP4188 [Burkholderia cenocepacia BC7]|nr:hypothetical protein BURCENBC7_AP4188 [Burkholderia cenocepacia BC7]